MVGVGISLSPRPSKFLTIFDINFSIVSESIGLFLVAILIDFEILSLCTHFLAESAPRNTYCRRTNTGSAGVGFSKKKAYNAPPVIGWDFLCTLLFVLFQFHEFVIVFHTKNEFVMICSKDLTCHRSCTLSVRQSVVLSFH